MTISLAGPGLRRQLLVGVLLLATLLRFPAGTPATSLQSLSLCHFVVIPLAAGVASISPERLALALPYALPGLPAVCLGTIWLKLPYPVAGAGYSMGRGHLDARLTHRGLLP